LSSATLRRPSLPTLLRPADTASDSPETLTIIAALQDVAAEGNAEALQTRWQSLTKEQRKAIGAARWEEIKRLLVIEGEASEVPE
jgi:uncharacterized protein HemY